MLEGVECSVPRDRRTLLERGAVKLEDEVWISPDGPVILSLYPFEERLL